MFFPLLKPCHSGGPTTARPTSAISTRSTSAAAWESPTPVRTHAAETQSATSYTVLMTASSTASRTNPATGITTARTTTYKASDAPSRTSNARSGTPRPPVTASPRSWPMSGRTREIRRSPFSTSCVCATASWKRVATASSKNSRRS
uniref:P15 n=1 Tax=Botryosphaeria dothidea botrexvirus 1 TaxID=2785370 RepID=A0A7T4X3X6_9VIRU|nr:P15 [Botryosphaeria dothidea botrexvirus 1]